MTVIVDTYVLREGDKSHDNRVQSGEFQIMGRHKQNRLRSIDRVLRRQ